MGTAILFFLSSLFVIFFIIIRIFTQSNSAKTGLDSSSSIANSQSGKIFLLIGPALIGLGTITWFGSEWSSIDTLIKIFISGGATIASLLFGFITTTLSKDNKKLPQYIIGESFLYLGTLLIGGFLFILNVYFVENGFGSFGVSEILGIWFLALLGITYYLRSVWGMLLTAIVHFFWAATFLSAQFTIYEFAGINSGSKLEVWSSVELFFLIGVLGVVASGVVASLIRTSYKHIDSVTSRTLQYLTSWMHYGLVGALIMRSIRDDSTELFNGNNAYITAIILLVVTALLLIVDYNAKTRVKDYTIHNLSLFAVITASIIGIIASQTTLVYQLMSISQPSPFFGFLFLEIAYIGWLLSAYVRDNDETATILFYGFNFIQLFVLTFESSALAIFKLITILAILMYAAIMHSYRKSLVWYVTIMGILTLMIRTITEGASIYVVLIVVGVIMMVFGIFFTQAQATLKNKKANDE